MAWIAKNNFRDPIAKKTEFKETDTKLEEVTIINGKLSGYTLRPIGDEFLKKRKVPKGAIRFGLFKPGAIKPYVIQIKDNMVSCGCPAWTRNADRECKHTREISNFLLGKIGFNLSNLDIEFEDEFAFLEFFS